VKTISEASRCCSIRSYQAVQKRSVLHREKWFI